MATIEFEDDSQKKKVSRYPPLPSSIPRSHRLVIFPARILGLQKRRLDAKTLSDNGGINLDRALPPRRRRKG
jgi:hypothetical protein